MTSMTGPWGQPTGDFFDESFTILLGHQGGFKLHVSVDPSEAEALAHVALPTLRLLHVHHKVVRSQALYEQMNRGAQRGKFITIYPGPARPSQRVVDTLEPTLIARGFRPGPVPTTRKSDHLTHEIRIGGSGMISCYWCQNYETE
jgi:hypothetical protein